MVEQLGELIHTTLRQCDVAARYSDMQYVIMLSGSAAETGSSPLERIKAAFYRVPAHGRYLLSYNAVSYTHLDVYKRQPPDPAAVLCEPRFVV